MRYSNAPLVVQVEKEQKGEHIIGDRSTCERQDKFLVNNAETM